MFGTGILVDFALLILKNKVYYSLKGEKKQEMEVIVLKIAAYITMLIDHTGMVFFPNDHIFRIIGRIAFPIFAFLAAEGAKKSSNVRFYLLRLFICGIVSEIPFDLMISGKIFWLDYQNVCFTLFFGVLSSVIYSKLTVRKAWYIRILGVLGSLVPIVLAGLLSTDYGAAGAALTLLFFVANGSKPMQALVFIFINTCMCMPSSGFDLSQIFSRTQMYGLLALPFILLYNGEKYPRAKTFLGRYAFYLFYPFHMLIIWFISILV